MLCNNYSFGDFCLEFCTDYQKGRIGNYFFGKMRIEKNNSLYFLKIKNIGEGIRLPISLSPPCTC